jgi:hypothetical protein
MPPTTAPWPPFRALAAIMHSHIITASMGKRKQPSSNHSYYAYYLFEGSPLWSWDWEWSWLGVTSNPLAVPFHFSGEMALQARHIRRHCSELLDVMWCVFYLLSCVHGPVGGCFSPCNWWMSSVAIIFNLTFLMELNPYIHTCFNCGHIHSRMCFSSFIATYPWH